MKFKLIFIFSFTLFAFLSTFGVPKALSEYLPTISIACEYKSGALYGVSDGFSLLNTCPKNSRKVMIVGQPGPVGPVGPVGPQGPKGDPGVSLKPENFYVKTFGPNPVTQNMASTYIYGCDFGDIALSGGMSNYSGAISDWRTVKNSPSQSELNQSNWETTVVNQVTSGSYWVTVKCLKLSI